jgi:AcrR family transcriptional regulator
MPRVSAEHRERQRRRILDAAVTCFDRRGLHDTTVQDVVAESGLSPGAIYTYFDGKEAIVEAIAAERHAAERALLRAALDGDDVRASVRSFLGRYLDWLADPEERRRRRVNVHVWAEALHNPRMAAVVAAGLEPLDDVVRAVRTATAGGRLPAHLDPEAFARTVLALLQGFVLQLAWDPAIDAGAYRATALAMVDALLDARPQDARPVSGA